MLYLSLILMTLQCSFSSGKEIARRFQRQVLCPGLMVSFDNCPMTVMCSSRIQCSLSCLLQQAFCVSFLWDSKQSLAYLCTTTVNSTCSNTQPSRNFVAYEKTICPNNRVMTDNGTCICPKGFSGNTCNTRMTDCNDWKAAGFQDGVYWILPNLALMSEAFPVMCSTQWSRTYIMVRELPYLDFYRNWTEYVNGFGDPLSDHWMGLKGLNLLSNSRQYSMIVEFTRQNGSYFQQWYKRVLIADERQLFKLYFNATYKWIGAPALGDCLSSVIGKPFSTYDADHDDDVSGNCAQIHESGWWFHNCTLCNPTGRLLQPKTMLRSGVPTEVYWTPVQGNYVPQKIYIWFQRV